ncbi:MAG: serine hydrolase [Planctomycetes bacterium]|nr:serine hydrolase [Planctomycetota bacterium]
MHRTTPLGVLLLATGVTAQTPTRELAEVAAAYAAKVAASAVFVSGRSIDSVMTQEFAPNGTIEKLIRPLLRFDVDREAGTVTCRLGQAKATAVRTAGLGCVLLHSDATLDELRRRGAPPASDRWPDATATDWPLGDRMPEAAATGIDRDALERALDAAFAEPDDGRRVFTRAVVVLHRGQLVAERYAADVTPEMPLPGWSMTKSLSNALLGFAVQQGRFELPPPSADGDAHGVEPDLYALLTMTAGKQWNESYEDPNSDALRMLFRSADHGAAFAAAPQAVMPGTRFQYASGATNLLCKLLRQRIDDDAVYHDLPRQLFRRLGMRSAVFEADPSGTFVGSSYGFASARDWARLGLLFAQDGVFAGQRLLPAGWVARSTAATAASGGGYGWQLWLNRDPDGDGPHERRWPDLPEDLFLMDGHEGQSCVVSPAAELIVVRLGCTKQGGFDRHALLRATHDALPRAAADAPGRR